MVADFLLFKTFVCSASLHFRKSREMGERVGFFLIFFSLLARRAIEGCGFIERRENFLSRFVVQCHCHYNSVIIICQLHHTHERIYRINQQAGIHVYSSVALFFLVDSRAPFIPNSMLVLSSTSFHTQVFVQTVNQVGIVKHERKAVGLLRHQYGHVRT